MKLSEFLISQDLELKVFACSNGNYRVGFRPSVEIKEGMFLKSECGDGSPDLITAINNTLKNISYKTLKINDERYISVLDVTL